MIYYFHSPQEMLTLQIPSKVPLSLWYRSLLLTNLHINKKYTQYLNSPQLNREVAVAKTVGSSPARQIVTFLKNTFYFRTHHLKENKNQHVTFCLSKQWFCWRETQSLIHDLSYVKSSKHGGNYTLIYNLICKTLHLLKRCIYMFDMVVTISSNFFNEQQLSL
jgi:hypothetical protein